MKRIIYWLGLLVLCVPLAKATLTGASAPESAVPAWASPSVMALKRIGPADSTQHEPNFLSNLDCQQLSYRLVADNTMRTGCFTETAFGLLDSDQDTVIFNGTDEALPLTSYSPHQVLAPWPKALNLVTLDAANTGGSYINLYTNPLSILQDQRNLLGQLTAKNLRAPPDLPLRDSHGSPLIVNPQTLAFSDGGSWLVVEGMNGSFIRLNLATLDQTAFAPAFGAQGSPALLKSRVAVSSDGHYAAIANDVATSLKVYDLMNCTGNLCKAYDYWPFVRQNIAGLQSIRHLRFVNDGLLSFEAQTTDPASAGLYELAPTESIRNLIDYLGLGDSYTSGEGAYNYLLGTDTADNLCHLSAQSYPLLLTRDLFSTAGGHSVACSGATIEDIASTSESYRGQVKAGQTYQQLKSSRPDFLASVEASYLPGIVAQQRFVKRYQPAITTVSAGGDDIGFGDLLERCVAPHFSRHQSDSTCFNTYEDRLEVIDLIDRTVPQWTKLYKQLQAQAPSTRLYAIGYPQIASDTGNCAVNVYLNKSELEFSIELVNYLNAAIAQAAAAAKVTYVDISQALVGHRLCETAGHNTAINGLTAGKDFGLFGVEVLGRESYHPNALGHELIEQATLKQTNNLQAGQTAPDSQPSSAGLLKNRPKSGRVVHKRVPIPKITKRVVKTGTATSVKISGVSNGLKAQTTYQIRLDGPSGPVINSVVSDTNGNIDGSVIIPPNTGPGSHSIDLTGENQAGEPVDVTQPIYLAVSDDDIDGDGRLDDVDDCPVVINSSQDADQDGIDDACDGFIGGATTSPGDSPPGDNSPALISNFSGSDEKPGGIPLTPTTSLVTSFVSTGGNKTSVAKILGAATTNPGRVVPGTFRNSGESSQPSQPPATLPRTMYWRNWIVYLVALWLLLILVAWLISRLGEQKNIPEVEFG